MSDKKLFKFWVENSQLTRFKALAKQEKTSVSWLMRRAFDEYLAGVKKGKKK